MQLRLKGRSSVCRAFTLIELLVTVVIILILAAILMPALYKMRLRAKELRCASNLRGIGVAISAFAQDHSGEFPGYYMAPPDAVEDNISWTSFQANMYQKLFTSRYVANTDLFFCPFDDERRPTRRDPSDWATCPDSNWTIAAPAPGRNIRATDHVWMGYWAMYIRAGSNFRWEEINFANRHKMSDHPRAIVAYDQFPVSFNSDGGHVGGPCKAFHPDGSINLLRVDGTVEWVHANRILYNQLVPTLQSLEAEVPDLRPPTVTN